MNRRFADRRFVAGCACSISDMAHYTWIVAWKSQLQDIDDFPELRRWFEAAGRRPATIPAFARGEPFSSRPTVTEEGKKILFGQTAATSAGSISSSIGSDEA
jgi:GST-like protein